MIAFLETVDDWFGSFVAARYPDDEMSTFLKSFGYTELVTRSNDTTSQVFPMVINGTADRGHQIALDDRFQVMTWFRLPGQVTTSTDIEGNNWAFGFQESPVQKAGIRWVIAHRVELGEEFIFDLLQNIPGKLSVDGYQIASIDRTSLNLDADHETIYRTELGNTVYEKHRFTWNLYVITLNLNYIINPNCSSDSGCCDNSFLSEDGTCLITE
jgi:hypothetical protein